MSRSRIDPWLVALTVPLTVVAAMVGGVLTGPPAWADCVSSNGTVLCSQGDSRGANTGPGPGVSYPCDFDWYCDYDGFDYGIVLDPDFDGGISRPNRPNNDLPGRGGGGRGPRR